MNGNATQNGTQSRDRKPRPKPERRIRVVEQPTADTDGWGAVAITVGQKTDTYLVHFLPSDFGFGAVGFEVEKLDADLATVESYHVHLADRPEECSCTCKGCSYHGHCKHVSGLKAATEAGKLSRRPVRQKMAACPRCQERVEAPGLCPVCTEDEAAFAAYHQADEMAEAGLMDEPPQLDEAAYFDPAELDDPA